MLKTSRAVAVILTTLASSAWCAGVASNLVLKKAWAEKYRNRLSIEAKITILHVSAKEQDADIHGGSRQNQIGLPMVAEILNGTQPTQKATRTAIGPGQDGAEKTIYGAWRLWFEHPPHGGGTQCQDFGNQSPALCSSQALGGSDSNPDHSFEIHPVFAINQVPSVGKSSMVLLPDNKGVKDSAKAFQDYGNKNQILTIARSGSGITLNSKMIGDNYVRMRIRITKAKSSATTTKRDDGSIDGGWVLADVISDDDDRVLAAGARIFYFLDSAPGDALQKSAAGTELEILGMPRLNLDTILRVSAGKDAIAVPLPIEFIAVALTSSP